MTDDELAALAPLLLPYRAQLESAWAGRQPATNPRAVPVIADLLDVPTVAARLSCSRPHVYDLLGAGELVRRNISARGKAKTRITAASVDDFIRRDQYRGMTPI